MRAVYIRAYGGEFVFKGITDKALGSQMITFIGSYLINHIQYAGIAV